MILSTPFSRQNRSHQSWTSSTVPRRPAPEQRAPERPTAQLTGSGNRSSTLNRLDWAKQRQLRQAGAQPSSVDGHFVRRNVSSLGHYPVASSSGTGANLRASKLDHNGNQIYAPASIASPSEYYAQEHNVSNLKHRTCINGFSHYNSPYAQQQQQQQQHYAATSVRSMPQVQVARAKKSSPPVLSGSESSGRRSGRESALGSLFGTLRRKAAGRWSASSSSGVSSGAPNGRQRSSSSLSNQQQQQRSRDQEPIYANGFLRDAPATGGGSNGASSKPEQRNKLLCADEIYAEGAHAIDSNAMPRLVELELLQEPEQWRDGETRLLIDDDSLAGEQFQLLHQTLVNWINDELAEQRIIIKDLREDLFDGQVLCKLIERLQGVKLDIVEVTQNEQVQKQKLFTLLSGLNKILSLQARWARIRWSVEGIHGKNLVEIIRLLVALAKYYRAPLKLPPNVVVDVSIYQKNSTGQLTRRSQREQLTEGGGVTADYARGLQPPAPTMQRSNNNDNNNINQQWPPSLASSAPLRRDAFDLLVEQAPDKLSVVAQTLLKFCNRHLGPLNMSAGQKLDAELFSDGLLLVFLISSLEGYFVPLGQLFTTIKRSQRPLPSPPPPLTTTITNSPPRAYQETSLDTLPFIDANFNLESSAKSFPATAIEPSSFINTQPIEKLHNVNLALQLMEEAGLGQLRQQVRAEDLANGDLKALLRVLYALFSRYKHV